MVARVYNSSIWRAEASLGYIARPYLKPMNHCERMILEFNGLATPYPEVLELTRSVNCALS